jgi:hypothetical protein
MRKWMLGTLRPPELQTAIDARAMPRPTNYGQQSYGWKRPAVIPDFLFPTVLQARISCDCKHLPAQSAVTIDRKTFPLMTDRDR